MRGKNRDLHGSAPDRHPVALLIVDMINDLDFDSGAALLAAAEPVARAIAGLKARARELRVPTIYVNDNHGRWRSDFRAQVRHVLAGTRGRPLAEALAPDDEDYFVLKPKHSGFYATTLELLLGYLEARTLVITGMRTDSCVLFTAADAYLREFSVVVPRDGAATTDPAAHETTLALMARELKADTRAIADLDLAALAR